MVPSTDTFVSARPWAFRSGQQSLDERRFTPPARLKRSGRSRSKRAAPAELEIGIGAVNVGLLDAHLVAAIGREYPGRW